MAEWEGKSKGTPFGYKIFIFLIKRVGLRSAYTLLYPVVGWYYFFSAKSNRTLRQYFQQLQKRFPNVVVPSRFRVYFNMGQVLIDKIAVIAGTDARFDLEHEGEEHLRNMDVSQTGGFLISAHIGNWEIAGHLMKRFSIPINIVLLDGEDAQIKKVMNKATGERHFNIIPMKDDMSHIFKIHQAAKNKELICIHGDRFLPGSKTLQTDFLNQTAHFPMGPFALASKMGLPVSFVYGLKENSKKYHFYCTPPLNDANQSEIFESYVKSVEGMVQQYPAQWYNFFDFWAEPATTTKSISA